MSYFWYSDNAIKLLWPDDSLLPNRKQLSSTLLDECHQEVLTKVRMCMTYSTFCLTIDGWSSVKNDPVVTYMAVSPECSFFLESVMTGQQQHNQRYIAEDIAHIIQKYESIELLVQLLTMHPPVRRLAYCCMTCSHLATSKDAVLMVFIILSRTSLQLQRLRRLMT